MNNSNELIKTILNNENFWKWLQFSLNGKEISGEELVALFNEQSKKLQALEIKHQKLNDELNESNSIRAAFQQNKKVCDIDYKNQLDALLAEYTKVCDLYNSANNTIAKLNVELFRLYQNCNRI
jgi:hypothetical protein